MRNLAVIGVLSALAFVHAAGIFAAEAAQSDVPPITMDARFSGFDAVGHIRRAHPSLTSRAEDVSHWAGYYSVNPMLLTQLLETRAESEVPTPDAIRNAARKLAALATAREDYSAGMLVSSIVSAYALSNDVAASVVEATRAELASEGMPLALAKASDTPPALDLPYGRPQAWQFNGVHTWTGDDDGSAMSSIDFVRSWSIDWGEDTSGDWVAASHDGLVTVYSSCFVQLQHDSGWATRYYHLDNLQVENGQRVMAGELLGNYAQDEDQALCSGGHSSGPHLHFALVKDGQYFSLKDMSLSGYLIHPGESSYDSSQERMWLEKRQERYYAFGEQIAQEEGDNTIDYRYNGMWYSPDHNGHGINIEITEFADADGPRKSVFVVLYTYDDAGDANFYVGNRDFDRWRSDEAMAIQMLQTSGGDFAHLSPVDFDNPANVALAGQLEIRFSDCANAEADFDLEERITGQPTQHAIRLVKLIGVPDHVCAAASLPTPD